MQIFDSLSSTFSQIFKKNQIIKFKVKSISVEFEPDVLSIGHLDVFFFIHTSSFLFICLFVHFNLFLTALNYILSLLQNLLKCTLSSFLVFFGRQGIMIKKEEQQFFLISFNHVST